MTEMLNQTFGVEIEMYNISRQRAAAEVSRVLSDVYGVICVESHVGGAYDAWQVPDGRGRMWQLMYDSSIIARSHAEKCELVTPILGWSDIDLLLNIVRRLRFKGARSNPAHSCGVHIHVGGDHTAQSLRNLANIMASHEQLLVAALGIDRGRLGRWCAPVDQNFLREVNQKKPTTLRALEDVWYCSQGCGHDRHAHYNASRYHILNLHSFFTGKGVEFRLFQFDNWNPSAPRGQRGGLHAGQLRSYIQLCLALNYRALHTRTAKYTPLESDNLRYTMRCWLLRLGFIGEEFATARELLIRRLPGDAAWRHGRPNKATTEVADIA